MSPDTPTANTPASPQPALPRGWSRRTKWLIAAVAGLGVGAGIWLVVAQLPNFLASGSPTPTPTPVATTEDTRRISATLFYVSEDGMGLTPAVREAAYGATTSEQIKHIVEAQIAAAPDGTTSAIPAGVSVRTVFVTPRGIAYVDFSPELAANQSGGSLDEALTIYAIVNAITINVRDVAGVQILIDGKDMETLAGHWDIGRPLGKSLTWIRKGQ